MGQIARFHDSGPTRLQRSTIVIMAVPGFVAATGMANEPLNKPIVGIG
jgi:hypothetical protein